MRLRVGAVLCLFLAFWGAGCRKAVAPVLDNAAPETWIISAPQDTITTRDDQNLPVRPNVGRIPSRFHLYWAGSDRDGQVAGYYFAVVETLPLPPDGAISVPSLPGPKARDYQFTTKTDSIFIFRASEDVSERQHAFFIYAVDNKGRPDATPARFIFSAYDRFPPLAIIDELKAEGTVYQLVPGGVQAVQRTYTVHDSFEVGSLTHFTPRDTVPGNAVLTMRWRGEPTVPSTSVTGFRYKLDESSFNTADSSVHTASYNTGVGLDKINPGAKIFTLRAIGQSGWRGERTRWFQMNFAPDTWYSGPDPNDPLAGWQTSTDGNGKRYWFIDLSTTGWATFAGVPGTQMSGDSVRVLPALRPERKSFMEVYNDRLWLRQEGDTVHMNSWVILPTGGFDQDSPYRVRVNQNLVDPLLAGLPVTTPSGPNGSPIGFRIQVRVKGGTDASNRVDAPSEGTTYPVMDPASVFHQPVTNGYWGMTSAGKAYAVVRAEDGDGTVDRRIDQRPDGAPGVADRVDNGVGSTEDIALRSKIMTFYVDRAPRLRTAAGPGGMVPQPNAVIANRTITNWNLPADDVDQYDPSQAAFNKVGGTPPYGQILRRKLAILGKLTGNPAKDTCYVVPLQFTSANGIAGFSIPAYIATGNITLRVRLCDCLECDDLFWPTQCGRDANVLEARPNTGRCVETDIPLRLTAAEPAAIVGPDDATQRPGSSSDKSRRQ